MDIMPQVQTGEQRYNLLES